VRVHGDMRWATPPWVYELCGQYFAFETDLAASPETALCARFYTEHIDSLTQTWEAFAG
jgi:hypothetical protein